MDIYAAPEARNRQSDEGKKEPVQGDISPISTTSLNGDQVCSKRLNCLYLLKTRRWSLIMVPKLMRSLMQKMLKRRLLDGPKRIICPVLYHWEVQQNLNGVVRYPKLRAFLCVYHLCSYRFIAYMAIASHDLCSRELGPRGFNKICRFSTYLPPSSTIRNEQGRNDNGK